MADRTPQHPAPAPPAAPEGRDDREGVPAAARPQAGKIGTGPGRLLLWLYGIFTVAALSRSIVQISTKFHHAPLAYVLSLVAGVLYAVILTALVKGGESARRLALVCCSLELLGVLTVGTLTVVDSSAFPDATVWSYYGAGYILLPVVLPVTGLIWLRRAAQPAADGTPAESKAA
ncbi:hypothetical protein [Actinacidiphila acididurans]|uniref:hypothetical protein n=1 Tax=Actinacidiphila acididurans TaxID=2784346 RepID=UPI001F3D75EA|nr:hypothetical protein [Actinacidiphila acididurans]